MQRRVWPVLGSLLFLFIGPGLVSGVVPYWITRWEGKSFLALRVAGAMLVLSGVPVLLEAFFQFAVRGLGTPAPILPPRHLVIGGFYRYVRNPMYVANLAIVFGQALWFANLRMVLYAGGLWLAFHLFVLLYEERTLRSRFGAEYDAFRAHVPRWIPRLRPWAGAS